MEQGTNGPLAVLFALVSSMLGGTILAIPLLFLQTGLVNGLLVMLVVGFVSWKTCSLYVIHSTKREDDFEHSVRRILGPRWERFFNFVTGGYLFCLNVLYMVLLNDQLYNVVQYAFTRAGHPEWLAPKDRFTFGEFSLQYLALATLVLVFLLLQLKRIDFLVKISSLGIFSIGFYFVFILWAFGDSLHTGVDWASVPLFRQEVGGLLGSSVLSYTIHTVVVSIVKTSAHPTRNERYLKFAYGIGTVIYVVLGLAGSIGVIGRHVASGKACDLKNAKTVLDCFGGSFAPVIIETLYFVQLLCLIPNFLNVTRNRLFLLFNEDPPSNKQVFFFNLGYLALAYGTSISEKFLAPADIMSLIGCVFCFTFVFLVPIRVHLKCYYRHSSLTRSLTDSFSSEVELADDCNPHYDVAWVSKPLRQAFYGALMLLGLAVTAVGLYQEIRGLAS
jgi:sodium-coupled neutral amino acid transporter 9